MHRPSLAAVLVAISLVTSVRAEDVRTITIEGYGELKAEPDVAEIDVAISIIDKDIVKSKKVVDATMSKLLEVARKLQIAKEDITATALDVQPDVEYNDGEKIVRYETSRQMTLKLRDLKKLDQLLTACVEAGVNRVQSVSLQSSKDEELRRKALSLAIADAKSRAKAIAAEFDAELGKVRSINAGRTGYRSSHSVEPSAAFSAVASYQPGQIEVSSDIEVVFELK